MGGREKTKAKQMYKLRIRFVVGNGHIHNRKAKFACKGCRHQFVENPAWRRISEETKALIDKLVIVGVGMYTPLVVGGLVVQSTFTSF